ncbi:hypothetical protein ACT16_21910, partial [Mycobacterium heckeshornense]
VFEGTYVRILLHRGRDTTTGDDNAGDGLSVVRSVARAVWDADLDGRQIRIEAADAQARDALRRWSLLSGQID